MGLKDYYIELDNKIVHRFRMIIKINIARVFAILVNKHFLNNQSLALK
jgi:hypothetical protein